MDKIQIRNVINHRINPLTTFIPVGQKIFNWVVNTIGCRRKTCEWLPWRAQIVAFTIGTAFLIGCAENSVDKNIAFYDTHKRTSNTNTSRFLESLFWNVTRFLIYWDISSSNTTNTNIINITTNIITDTALLAVLHRHKAMFNVFHVRALYYTKTLITNKCTKRVLASIVTHSYMFRPCWVIFRENFLSSLH
jgi:hypothetical protein